MKYLLGIDIGGTSTKIGLLDFSGNIIEKFEISTNKKENGKYILEEIRDNILSYFKDKINIKDIKGIGFGVPGCVCNGIVYCCDNLGWDKKNIVDDFKSIYPYEVICAAENDANMAALGETSVRNLNNAALFTLGTGVGGGIIFDGKPFTGSSGSAGELGHIIVSNPHHYKCGCGRYDCLETLASATGIVHLFNDYKAFYPQSKLNKIDNVSAKDIFDSAKDGDELGIKIVDEVTTYLAFACSIVSVTINPDTFIFGGGVSKAGDILITKIQEKYLAVCNHLTSNVHFSLAKLSSYAGVVGAALFAKMKM